MNSYRNDMNQIDKEVPFTAWKIFKWLIIALIVLVPVGLLLRSTGIISMNIDREVVQHSQQYVETKVNLLNKLYGDYLQLEGEIAETRATNGPSQVIDAKLAQQKNTASRIRTEAGMIPSSQVPTDIKAFLEAHPR